MARKMVGFKFSDEDNLLLGAVKEHSLATSLADALRIALREYAERHGLLVRVRDEVQRRRQAMRKPQPLRGRRSPKRVTFVPPRSRS